MVIFHMENISVIVAFSAGLLSFLSPCVLPLVPVYLASLAGPEIFGGRTAGIRVPVFFHSLSFVLGFSLVFTTMGAIAGLTAFAINPSLTLLNKISGSLLIAFGLFILVALKVPPPDRPAKDMQKEPECLEYVFDVRDTIERLEASTRAGDD